MNYAHEAMETAQDCKFVSLHVRVSNRAALGAYEMKKILNPHKTVMCTT
jgi:hypothetical protein